MSPKRTLFNMLRELLVKGKTAEEMEKEISNNIKPCCSNLNSNCQTMRTIGMSNESALMAPDYASMFERYSNPSNLVTAEIKDRSHIMTASGIVMPEATPKPTYNIMVHVPSNFICVEHFASSIGFDWRRYFTKTGKYFAAMEDRAEYYAKKHGCSPHHLIYWDNVVSAQGTAELTPVLAHNSLASVILYYHRQENDVEELLAKQESARFRRRFESKKFRRENGLTSRFLVNCKETSSKKTTTTTIRTEVVPSPSMWAVQPPASENLTGALAITKSIDNLADAVNNAMAMIQQHNDGITKLFDLVRLAHNCLFNMTTEMASTMAAEKTGNSGPAKTNTADSTDTSTCTFPKLKLPPQ